MRIDDKISYHFEENGGYDCMYSSFSILDSEGRVIAEIDFRYYGQYRCQPPDSNTYGAAKLVAEKIVRLWNDEVEALK